MFGPRKILPSLLILACCIPLDCAGCIGTKEWIVDPFEFDQGIETIKIYTDSGDIQVKNATGATIKGETKWQAGTSPEISTSVQSDTLTIISACPSTDGDCLIQHELKAPSNVYVYVYSDTGDIDFDSFEGDAETPFDGGDLTMDRVGGDVYINGTDGDFQGTKFTSPTLTAQLVGGSIEVAFDETPDKVSLFTDSGDIDLRIPSGEYRISVNSDTGDVNSDGVTNSTSASSEINVVSNSGNITLSGT